MYYEIKTERLLLRPVGVADLNAIREYDSDEENTRYMLNMPNRTVQETIDFLTRATDEWNTDSPRFYKFAVMLSGTLIGVASVYPDESKTVAELGYILNKRYWGNGYAFEAALAIKDFAINVLRVKKLFAHCDYRNAPSLRLMEKLGLKLESDDGTRFYPKKNETAREITYSLTVEGGYNEHGF